MLVMTIVLSVGLLVLSIFLLSYFSHSDDKGFGASLVCKISIVNINKTTINKYNQNKINKNQRF